MPNINRREFLKLGLSAGSLLALGSPSDLVTKVFGKADTHTKVLILGFDGMDAHLTNIWMNQGKLPAFERLRNRGGFTPLQTSLPPQSPVAWSNFITGLNPGGHGIFDFIHRTPEYYLPTFSSTKTSDSTKTISIGNLVLPLSGGTIENMMQGRAFWQILEDHDIPATIFKMPSNFPPVETKQKTLSGMGTPDITGSLGEFNYYTTEVTELQEDLGGGEIHEVYVIGNRVEAKLPGPENAFKKNQPESSIDFKVFIDPVHPLAKIVIQDQEFILQEKEWSRWRRVRFPMIPTQSVSGICMFYLKQVRPDFKLYISPINIDPAAPAMPISTPASYAKELEKEFGPFYTKGLPADFKAMSNGILDEEEYLAQDDTILEERKAMFEYELSRFDSGLLFYYVSSTDQRQHMFWRFLDPQSPMYDPALVHKHGTAIEDIYREADNMLDMAMSKADKDTIIMVMSDHGFTPFRRTFNINSWLKENGYIRLINNRRQGQEEAFMNTDWSRTKAYSYGLNSLYINLRGREGEGIVNPGAEKEALVREIVQKLEKVADPKTGERVITKAYITQEDYLGSQKEKAPEIIVGYNRGFRTSWSAPLGRITKEVFADNMDKWSGDHCMDPAVCPGILFSSEKIRSDSPALFDLTPTILSLFGIEKPDNMVGKKIF
ncbi:MAG: alkaline phosphatase family protein [Candidatus Aminicenantes bacterium]|nr:MAG: alkaline phosphatase family protein [Candidatus Aminicenantes bacterium]